MRMRAKKNLHERMERCSDIQIKDPDSIKGKWKSIFGNNNPVYLEIGCGKGSFAIGMATRHPDINFIAMEKEKNIIVSAMEKVKADGLANIRFICDNADILEEYFEENECDRLFLNFSDPLPKQGYRKRRLTHERYLRVYGRILKDKAEIHQKTDNRGFFEFSLNSFTDFGFTLKNISLDLHSSGFADNIITEYETKFSEMGMPIYRVEAINNKRGKYK